MLSSYAFSPSIGGIETVSAILGTEFAGMGHSVKLITETAGPDTVEWPFEVIRQPSLKRILELVRWSDVLLQNNISLRSLWAAPLLRRPAVIAHQTWIASVEGGLRWRDRLKRALLPKCENIAISSAIGATIRTPHVVIGNPYRDDLFQQGADAPRERDLIFAGRLVSDKGVDLLFRALNALGRKGLKPDLTVVGGGPEEGNLRRLAGELGIAEQVDFRGPKNAAELAKLFNAHRILVVPSRWAEPFGVVALEGAASGCVVVGSEQGGLKEAIGPCGRTFENGNMEALAAALAELLGSAGLRNQIRSHAEAHLQRFKGRQVAGEYMGVIERAIAREK